MSNENKELTILDKFELSKENEFKQWKEKGLQLIKENPFIEVVDNETYKEAKKRRTNIKTGRTDVEKQDRALGSAFSALRKKLKEKALLLVSDLKPLEEKQQSSIDLWENKKAEEKREKEKLEEKRIQDHKDNIEAFKERLKLHVELMTLENIEETKSIIKDEIVSVQGLDFEEFDILKENVIEENQSSFDFKLKELEEKKEQIEVQKKKDIEAEFNKVELNIIDIIESSDIKDLGVDLKSYLEIQESNFSGTHLVNSFQELVVKMKSKANEKVKQLNIQKQKDDEIALLKKNEADRLEKERIEKENQEAVRKEQEAKDLKEKQRVQEIESTLKTMQSDLNDVVFNVSVEEGFDSSKKSVENACKKLEELDFDFAERKEDFNRLVTDFMDKSGKALIKLEQDLKNAKELEDLRLEKAKKEAEVVLKRIQEECKERISYLLSKGFVESVDELEVQIWVNELIGHDYSIEFIEDSKEEGWKNQCSLIEKDIQRVKESEERNKRLFSDKNKMSSLVLDVSDIKTEEGDFENEESEHLIQEIVEGFDVWRKEALGLIKNM